MPFRARNSFPVPSTAVRRSRTDSGWSMVALAILLAVVAGVVIALVALLGGGQESVASRSAAAFEEAQRKGIPVGEAEHGGHGAVSPGSETDDPAAAEKFAASAEHGGMEMPSQGEAKVSTHDGHAMTGAMAGGGSPHAGMQHGSSAAGPAASASAHAGMQHGSSAAGPAASASAHAGIQHRTAPSVGRPGSSKPTTAGHAGHAGMEMPDSASPEPLAKTAVASPGQPAATLAPDSLDAPAATSEIDAKRSSEMAASMGSGGMQHSMGSYSQLDAGRESVRKTQPDHQGMGHGSMPPAAPTPTPDTKKPRPAATPVPTPSGHVHPSGGGQR